MYLAVVSMCDDVVVSGIKVWLSGLMSICYGLVVMVVIFLVLRSWCYNRVSGIFFRNGMLFGLL